MAALPAARGLSGPCLKSAVVVAALLVGCAPGVAAGGVGEAVAGALAEPVLRGVRHWRSINETTGTEPFLQSFINGQIVSYVNSCQPEYLLADGAPDCDEIEGDCADSGEACEYVYAIESLVVAGAIMGVLLVAAFISSLLVSACCGARLRHAAWDSGLAGSGGAALVAKTHHRASFYLVPLLAAVVALNTLLGFVAGLEMGQDVLDLLEGVKTATKVPGSPSPPCPSPSGAPVRRPGASRRLGSPAVLHACAAPCPVRVPLVLYAHGPVGWQRMCVRGQTGRCSRCRC